MSDGLVQLSALGLTPQERADISVELVRQEVKTFEQVWLREAGVFAGAGGRIADEPFLVLVERYLRVAGLVDELPGVLDGEGLGTGVARAQLRERVSSVLFVWREIEGRWVRVVSERYAELVRGRRG